MNYSFIEYSNETCDLYNKGKQKYYYYFQGNDVLLIKGEEKRHIAKGVPHIARIRNDRIYDKYEDFILDVHITVNIVNKELERSGEVLISLRDSDIKQADISDGEIADIIPDLYRKKHIDNKAELGLLLKRYIFWALKYYMENNSHLFAKCGWFRWENGWEYECEYYSVTKRGSDKLSFVPGMIGESSHFDHMKGKSIQELIGDCNGYKEFFDLIKSHRNLLGIFAYTLNSILWDYIYQYSTNYNDAWLDNLENKGLLFFSACLYGQDVRKANVIANILTNLFEEPAKSWIRIPLKPHISATSANTRVEKLNRYKSVPIIVTTPSNKITKASKVFKELNRYRNGRDLFVYPVYINNSPIKCDEVINFDVDMITLPFAHTDNEKATKIHRQMGKLLYCFMVYLQENAIKENKKMEEDFHPTDIKMMADGMLIQDIDARWEWFKETQRPKFFSEIIDYIQKKYGFDELCVYNNIPICVLYGVLRYFCVFLSEHGIDRIDLLDLYEKSYFQTKHENSDGRDQGNNKADHQKYLQCLKSFIDKSMKQKEEWIKIDCLPRGNKDQCYYLVHDVWFDKFYKYMENVGISTIKRQNMFAILKENGLLKKSNNNSNRVLREGTYYTVIYMAAFESLIQSWSLEE